MSEFKPPDISHSEEPAEPTCGNCAAWTGEECRCNPPVALVLGQQVVTVFPRTASSAWCLMHELAVELPDDGPGELNG